MIPDGPKVELKDVIESNPDLQKEIKHKPETGQLINFRAASWKTTSATPRMHAAGVVIAPRKLTEFMPLYKTKDDITTQFEKDGGGRTSAY